MARNMVRRRHLSGRLAHLLGVTVAPFGHIHEPGLRFRLAGGYGNYDYSGNRKASASRPKSSHSPPPPYYGDALVGYLERFGPLTAKAFGGVSYLAHDITPFDPEKPRDCDEFGFQSRRRTLLDIGDVGYASLDLAWNSAFNTRNARARLGAH